MRTRRSRRTGGFRGASVFAIDCRVWESGADWILRRPLALKWTRSGARLEKTSPSTGGPNVAYGFQSALAAREVYRKTEALRKCIAPPAAFPAEYPSLLKVGPTLCAGSGRKAENMGIRMHNSFFQLPAHASTAASPLKQAGHQPESGRKFGGGGGLGTCPATFCAG